MEFCFFVGNCYGTPKSIVDNWRDQGKNVFLEIEINGASQVIEKTKGDGVISIFLMPPSFEELINNEEDEILTNELKKMVDLEYTTGKEKIYGNFHSS